MIELTQAAAATVRDPLVVICSVLSRQIVIAFPVSPPSTPMPRIGGSFSPSTQPGGPFGGLKPCCGCERRLTLRAPGRYASRLVA
jgi:hypothetical protein